MEYSSSSKHSTQNETSSGPHKPTPLSPGLSAPQPAMGSWVDVVSSDVFPASVRKSIWKGLEIAKEKNEPCNASFRSTRLAALERPIRFGELKWLFYFFRLGLFSCNGRAACCGRRKLFIWVCVMYYGRMTAFFIFEEFIFPFWLSLLSGFRFLVTTYYLLDGVQLDQIKSLNILFLIDRLLGRRMDEWKEGKVCVSWTPRRGQIVRQIFPGGFEPKRRQKPSHLLRPH